MWLASFFLPFSKWLFWSSDFLALTRGFLDHILGWSYFLVALGIYNLHGIDKFSIKLYSA